MKFHRLFHRISEIPAPKSHPCLLLLALGGPVSKLENPYILVFLRSSQNKVDGNLCLYLDGLAVEYVRTKKPLAHGLDGSSIQHRVAGSHSKSLYCALAADDCMQDHCPLHASGPGQRRVNRLDTPDNLSRIKPRNDQLLGRLMDNRRGSNGDTVRNAETRAGSTTRNNTDGDSYWMSFWFRPPCDYAGNRTRLSHRDYYWGDAAGIRSTGKRMAPRGYRLADIRQYRMHGYMLWRDSAGSQQRQHD